MSKMNAFINYAAPILADTESGISTTDIIDICSSYAVDIILIFHILQYIKLVHKLFQIKGQL